MMKVGKRRIADMNDGNIALQVVGLIANAVSAEEATYSNGIIARSLDLVDLVWLFANARVFSQTSSQMQSRIQMVASLASQPFPSPLPPPLRLNWSDVSNSLALSAH